MKRKIIVLAIVLLFVAGIITLHLVQPKISYAFAELICAVSFIGGGAVGYLIKDHIKF